ncbi:MAG: RibD family protein, partial [Ignavibacteriota bacterium]
GARLLRRWFDSKPVAVLVSSATVLSDDPQLNVRLVKGRSPRRVILDANLRVPETAKVYSDNESANTIIVTTARTLEEKKEKRKELEAHGVTFLAANAPNNQFVLKDVFSSLGKLEITSILVEPGPTLSTVLLQEKLFDELVLFVAPILLGSDARPAFGDLHLKNFQQAHRLRFQKSSIVEGSDDFVLEYRNTI